MTKDRLGGSLRKVVVVVVRSFMRNLAPRNLIESVMRKRPQSFLVMLVDSFFFLKTELHGARPPFALSEFSPPKLCTSQSLSHPDPIYTFFMEVLWRRLTNSIRGNFKGRGMMHSLSGHPVHSSCIRGLRVVRESFFHIDQL